MERHLTIITESLPCRIGSFGLAHTHALHFHTKDEKNLTLPFPSMKAVYMYSLLSDE